MRTRVDASALADSLGWILPCVPRTPAVPVQAGVLLDAGDELTVEAAGHDASMKSTVPSAVVEPGSVVIPGRFLHQLASTLSGPIDLIAEGSSLRLACGRSSYELPLFPSAEYVRSVYDDVEMLGEVDAAALKAGLAMVAHAVDASRNGLEVLKGVHLIGSKEDGRLWLEGTDRYRLARTFVPWVGDSFESLPDGGHLADILKGLDKRLKLGVTAGRLMIADPDRSAILASYSAGNFPRLDGLLQATDRAYEVTFDRVEILTALKRLGQLRETKMSPVWLDVRASGVCEIELVNGDSRRTGTEQVDCEATADLALSFNPIYLAETIAAHSSVERVTLSAKAVGVRTPPRVSGDSRLDSVVMQIRVPEREGANS